MALVIAAGVFIGDLITVVTYFLRGDTTSRFLGKAMVVLLISGGVFFHYFVGLRKSEKSETRGWTSRDSWMAALSSVVVAMMVILGFWNIGAPRTQRLLRADRKRVQDLYALSAAINTRWNSEKKKLPSRLDELSGVAVADPVTHAPYEYALTGTSEYDLCATFSLDSKQNDTRVSKTKWAHPPGHFCFKLDATQTPENPNFYFSD